MSEHEAAAAIYDEFVRAERRAIAAEAERDRYKTALEHIVAGLPECGGQVNEGYFCARCIASAGLTPPAPEQGDA